MRKLLEIILPFPPVLLLFVLKTNIFIDWMQSEL